MNNTYEITAQTVGIIAMLVNISSFQCKDTKKLYICQSIGAGLFMINYIMLGAYTGAVLNLLGVLRACVMMQGDKLHKKYVLALLVLAQAAAGIITFDGSIMSFVPVAAQIIGTFTMWSGKGNIIRIGQFFAVSPLWIVYNVVSRSIGGLICELLTVLSIVIYVIRCVISRVRSGKEPR